MSRMPRLPGPMARPSISFLLGIVIALSGLSGPASAEIEPKYYAESQRSAPEQLEILVKTVAASACPFDACDKQAITVSAEVLKVSASATGLKAGAVITIKYDRLVPERGEKGPRPIRTLEKGERVPAWLQKGPGDFYGPAARGASFQAAIEDDPPEPLPPTEPATPDEPVPARPTPQVVAPSAP